MTNNINELISKVRDLYVRFNNTYGNMIDMNKVDEALKSIVVAKNNFSNVPFTARRYMMNGSKGLFDDKNIYVKNDITVDVLFHEILHYITDEHKGLELALFDSYTDNEFNELCDKHSELVFLRQFEQFNESMTRFITEQAIPEVKVEDAYEYGANVIRTYYDKLVENNIDPMFIFDMYFNGRIEDMMKFKESFGSDFGILLETIEKVNNKGIYAVKIAKAQKENPNLTINDVIGNSLTDDELVTVIDNAVSNLNVRQ